MLDNSRFRFMFRVWDKVLKVIRYSDYIMNSSGELFKISLDGELSRSSDEPMKFTGLYDCEGKEIWEGDVVQVQPLEEVANDEKWLYEVKFIDGCFCGIGLLGGEGDQELLMDLVELNMCKIIGNRFENPELFGGKV